MTDRFTLSPFEFFVRHTRTRFPFRYGIASMTEVPHLFVRTTVTAEEKSSFGLSSEGLPPKWFTKDPSTTFEQDLPEMLEDQTRTGTYGSWYNYYLCGYQADIELPRELVKALPALGPLSRQLRQVTYRSNQKRCHLS